MPVHHKYLSRSAPAPAPLARVKAARPHPDQCARVTVVLVPRSSPRQRLAAISRMAELLPQKRSYLDSEELAREHGAAPKSADCVHQFASRHHLEVVETSLPRRSVELSGTLSALERAFGVEFLEYDHPHGAYRSHFGRVRIPSTLAPHVRAVLGLDQRPLLRQHFAAPAAAAHRGMNPQEMARLYAFPENTAKGQTIGVIVVGGGFYLDDVHEYVGARGAHRAIRIKEVGGGANRPAPRELVHNFLTGVGMEEVHAAVRAVGKGQGHTTPSGLHHPPPQLAQVIWTLETSLDVEMVALLAPEADINVYFAENSEQGQFQALSHAICDPDAPSVISCSWGNEELEFTREWMSLADELFQFAVLAGITFCYSSGDDGDGSDDGGPPSAHFPASSPHVLACGGTTVSVRDGRLHETVWSELLNGVLLQSGGGVSRMFKQPAWQSPAHVHSATKGVQRAPHGSGVPDIAAKANFTPGYEIRVAGINGPLGGGTSAAAPLWAALVARLNAALGTRCGHLNPLLYSPLFRLATHEILEGNTGKFSAHKGWSACTGLGTPRGETMLSLLRGSRS